MAIYHFSVQIISRGKGQSAVASAAYRSGDRLVDERTGEKKYYSREVKPETMILAPSDSPEWVYDREQLWNEVEDIEKRKDAQLAREINVALPRELSYDQQSKLIRNFVQSEFVDKGMVVDLAIHRDDKENPHAHVMLTTRNISVSGFGPKNRDWNDRALLNQWREKWAEYANQSLEQAGVQEEISHLSHEARGLETMPTIHLGHVSHAMEKRGVDSNRGDINRDRQEYNALVIDLAKVREEKRLLKEKQKVKQFNTPVELTYLQKATNLLKEKPTLKNLLNRREQLQKWTDRIKNGDQYLSWKDEKIGEAADHFRLIHSFEKQIQDAEQQIESINWFNPLKLKENRLIKGNAEEKIDKAKESIISLDKQMDYHRNKLKFQTEKEFNLIQEQHKIERPVLIKKSENSRNHIRYELETIKNAEIALRNAFIGQVASLYPEPPELSYMDFKTAMNLMEINNLQNKVVPIETIKTIAEDYKKEVPTLKDIDKQIPVFKNDLLSDEDILNLFNAAMNGIQQAGREMDREQTTKKQQQHKKKKRARSQYQMER